MAVQCMGVCINPSVLKCLYHLTTPELMAHKGTTCTCIYTYRYSGTLTHYNIPGLASGNHLVRGSGLAVSYSSDDEEDESRPWPSLAPRSWPVRFGSRATKIRKCTILSRWACWARWAIYRSVSSNAVTLSKLSWQPDLNKGSDSFPEVICRWNCNGTSILIKRQAINRISYSDTL